VDEADGVPRPAKAGAADLPERERIAEEDGLAARLTKLPNDRRIQ